MKKMHCKQYTIFTADMALLSKGKTVAHLFDICKGEHIRDTYDLYTLPKLYVTLSCSPVAIVKQYDNSSALAPQRATFAVWTTPLEPVSQAAHSQREVLQTSDRKCVHRTDGPGSNTSWSAC